jgi:hypothetical protein
MAGRCISVTHEALGTVRVMRTGGCMGEIVGMAASVCKKHDIEPRGVYDQHLAELIELLRRGAGKAVPPAPPSLESLGHNVAPEAQVLTSGDRDSIANPPSLLNDGKATWVRNDLRWLSRAEVPNWVELRWPNPKTLIAARVLSGYDVGGTVEDPITSFVLQVFDEGTWRDVPGTRTSGNRDADWQRRFDPVRTERVRLLVNETKINISRIWEIELYESR